MELQALARQVLISPSLEDKLVIPDELTDRCPGDGAFRPSEPARPPGLRLDDDRPRSAFPRPSQLHAAEARGRALHFFANHELLAIELMAVCLLAFPEAPSTFRFGVAHTLLEEQRHLRMYRTRMLELGVGLGDVPVGGHFWRVLAGMRSPLEYVAGMSLVFEQANLDHAALWARRFRDAEDVATAELMELVLEEEVGHVKHGATWFERWRSPGPAFSAFVSALPVGLDAVRARGPVLQVAPRLQAGLSRDFISALANHRASKGRRPRLWAFWPDIEEHAAGRPCPSRRLAQLTADLAPAFGVLGSDDDLVLAPKAPSSEHRALLSTAGLATPRPVEQIEDAKGLQVDEVRSWGWSGEVRRRLRPVHHELRVKPPEAHPDRLRKSLVEEPRRTWIRRGHLAPDRAGAKAEGVDQVAAYQARVGVIRVKAAFGASGRRQRILRSAPRREDRQWIRRALSDGPVWMEPELVRVADFGLILPPQGKPTLFRMLTDARGAYRGHVLGAPELGLPDDVAAPLTRFPDGGMAGLVRRLAETAREAVPEGPVGVDLLVERRETGLALQPLVEINARYTMGHIAVALRRQLAPGRVAVWAHVPRRALKSGRDFPTLARTWAEPHIASGPAGPKIAGGVLPTTDPSRAEVMLTALSVAKSLEQAMAQLGEASPPR